MTEQDIDLTIARKKAEYAQRKLDRLLSVGSRVAGGVSEQEIDDATLESDLAHLEVQRQLMKQNKRE